MIGIFCKTADHYNRRMALGLSLGFKDLGVNVAWAGAIIEPEKVNDFCKEVGVTLAIEINRTREMSGLDDKIMHVSWIQDPEVCTGIDTSDVRFYLHDPARMGYFPGKYYELLFTGFDRQPILEWDALDHDFSMIGYIPRPMPLNVMQLPLWKDHAVTIGAVADTFKSNFRTYSQPLEPYHFMYEFPMRLLNQLKAQYGVPLSAEFASPDFREYFQWYIPRTLDRLEVCKRAMAISDRIGLYGEGWENHNALFRHWNGIICQSIQTVNVHSKINLHTTINGFGVHSRVLDCMGAGGLVFAQETPFDKGPGGIASAFEPWEHYIPWNFQNFEDLASKYLGYVELRRLVYLRAREEIKRAHLWKHRAEQVLGAITASHTK